MAWRAAIVSLLIAPALLLPIAAGVPVEGSLTIESGAVFPAGAALALTSGIAFSQETSVAQTLEGAAARMHVRLFEQRLLTVAGVVDADAAGSIVEQSWDLTNVTLHKAGESGRSAVAMEAHPGGRVTFLPYHAFDVTHRTESQFSSDGRAHPPSAPGSWFYSRRYLGDHLHARGEGEAALEGAGMVRVQGGDLVLMADENVTTVWTGVRTEGPTQSVRRWVVLEVEAAAVSLRSPNHGLEVVGTESPLVAWRGTATVVTRDGVLVGREVVYSGTGKVALAGDLEATLRPTPGASTMRLANVRGDLRETTLEAFAQAAPAPVRGLPSPLVLVALVAGTVLASTGAAAGVLALRGRRTRVAPVAPPAAPVAARDMYQHCLDYADFFEREDDPAAARECLGAARAFAEEDEYDVVLWEATCCERLGNLEDALERYEAAVLLAPKGDAEAAFGAAMVAGQLGRVDAALTSLRLALMADPALLESLDDFDEEEDPFRALRASPEFRRLRRDARAWARSMDE